MKKYDRFVRPSRPHLCWKRRKASRLHPADRCAGLDPSRRASGQKISRAMDVNASGWGSKHECSNRKKGKKTKWNAAAFQSHFSQFTCKIVKKTYPASSLFFGWAATIFDSKTSAVLGLLFGQKIHGSFSIHLGRVCIFPSNSPSHFSIRFPVRSQRNAPLALDSPAEGQHISQQLFSISRTPKVKGLSRCPHFFPDGQQPFTRTETHGYFPRYLRGKCSFPGSSSPCFTIMFPDLLLRSSPPVLDNRMGVVSQLDILPKGRPFGNPKAGSSRRFASRTPKGRKT